MAKEKITPERAKEVMKLGKPVAGVTIHGHAGLVRKFETKKEKSQTGQIEKVEYVHMTAGRIASKDVTFYFFDSVRAAQEFLNEGVKV